MKAQIPTQTQSQASPPRVYHGGGKRKKQVTQKRTKGICLRLSPEEHQMVREKAQAAGMSVSALLRDHLCHTQIYNHKETQIWLATLLSIRKVLVALAERAVVFRPADAVIAIAYLASIARQLEEFERHKIQYAHKIFP
jgi:hypothetical protein